MMSSSPVALIIAAAALLLGVTAAAPAHAERGGRTFYVDATAGSDGNSGRSPGAGVGHDGAGERGDVPAGGPGAVPGR